MMRSVSSRRHEEEQQQQQQRRAMRLVGLLATTALIALVQCAVPLAQAAPTALGHNRARIPVDRDHYLLIMLLNRKDFGSRARPAGADEAGLVYSTLGVDTGGGGSSNLIPLPNLRDKRVGSLSVVNSVDVMRERVMLELARRKAAEDAMMQNLNQRDMLNYGKRSPGPPGRFWFKRAGREPPELAEENDRLDKMLMQSQ